MRGLTLATLLAALPACTIDNPWFGLASDGVRPTGTSSAESGETSGVTTTSTSGPGSSASGSGTTDPNVTSSVDSTGGVVDTGEPQPMCTPSIDDTLDPHLYFNGVQYTDCQDQTTKSVIGKLEANAGAISMDTNINCAPGDEGTTITLGAGYPLPDKFIGCAKATVTWDKTRGDCAIGLLDIRDTMTEKIYYLGAFNNYPDMGSLPIEVAPMQSTNCGCVDGIPGCCAPLDAGDLELVPGGGGPVPPQANGPVALDESNVFEFYNIESYVDSTCAWHIDWIAASVP